jgi:divalent metal cation (Fe/Co/Zn/Cd) transporter
LKYSDLVGSLFVGILIIMMSYKILKENILSLIGEVCDDKELLSRIEKSVESIDGVELVSVKLIKYGSYYKADIEVELDPNITIMKLARLEKRILKKIKKEKIGIKYLTMEVEPDSD